MSVAEAQRTIDSREFGEWVAYDRLEPFGETRADLRAAIATATTANAWRGGKGRAFEVSDFMPTFGDERTTAQGADEMQNLLSTYAEAHNAAIKRGG